MKLITMQRNLTPFTFSGISFWSCVAVPFFHRICWRPRTHFISLCLWRLSQYATDCPDSLHRVDFQPLAVSYRTPLVSYAENPRSARFAWRDIAPCYSELNRPRLSPNTFPELTRQAFLNTPPAQRSWLAGSPYPLLLWGGKTSRK